MQDALKKEFTLRITQANRSELIVIIYEMCLAYLKDAIEGTDRAENITRARACVDELKESLNFEYELSADLLHFYIKVNKLFMQAAAGGRTEPLVEAESAMGRMRDAFVEISKEDDSKPLLHNAQEVYAGYTYGKNDVNVSIGAGQTERGFRA